MGPGDTLRSHSADEFIYLNEIRRNPTVYQNNDFSNKILELIPAIMQSFIFKEKIKGFSLLSGLELSADNKIATKKTNPRDLSNL
jgi:hypothetical protein